MPMNVLDAAYNTVNDYPGGAASLAPRIGKSASSLAHELRAQGTAKLGLLDAVKIMEMADNNAILEAMAACRDCDLIPRLLDVDPVSCTGKGLRLLFKEAGAFAEQVVEAEEDGRFTLNELKAAQRHWQRVSAQGNAVLRAMRAKHLADFPDSDLPAMPGAEVGNTGDAGDAS